MSQSLRDRCAIVGVGETAYSKRSGKSTLALNLEASLRAIRDHWADVGGSTPGSYSGLSTNIHQEGVRIPPIKICEEGKVNRAAMALLLNNMRLPEDRLGDFHASLGACRVAESRIRGLLARYGRKTVLDCIAINLDRSERRIRQAIAVLPDGEYVYEDYLEFYQEGRSDPVLMRLTLTVQGDEIVADFAGSNPQVPGVVNSTLATTGAGVLVAVKSTLDPEGPVNHGVFRPIRLKAPEASIVDVKLDAPAGAHGEVRKRAVSVMMGALAQIIPDLVSGDLCGTSFPNAIGGRDHRRQREYVYYEAPAGGNGGFREDDGSSAVEAGADEIHTVVSASESHNIANVNMTIAESIEKLRVVMEVCRRVGKPVVAGISTAFGCPFEGEVPLQNLESVVARLADLGARGIVLADTTGMANPVQVARTFEHLTQRFPTIEWTLHTHDTRAMAIPNILAAMACGVTCFDASIGGLGGCPFAPGASGNVCTEDLVHCLHAMGVETDIDLDRLIETAKRVQDIVGRTLPGQIIKAGKADRRYPVPDSVHRHLASG